MWCTFHTSLPLIMRVLLSEQPPPLLSSTPIKVMTMPHTLLCFYPQPFCTLWTTWGATRLHLSLSLFFFPPCLDITFSFPSCLLPSFWSPQPSLLNLAEASPPPGSLPWSLLLIQKTLLHAHTVSQCLFYQHLLHCPGVTDPHVYLFHMPGMALRVKTMHQLTLRSFHLVPGTQ